MVSYVEQAILRVKDESTSKLVKINRELKSLFATAKGGRDIKIKMSGLDKAENEANSLRAALSKLPNRKNVQIGVSGGSTMQQFRSMAEGVKKLQGARIKVPVSLPGIVKALGDLRDMRDLVNNINQKTVRPGVRVPGGGKVGGGPYAGSPYGQFPGNIASALNFHLANMTIQAAQVVLNAAAVAGLAGQAEETRREITINNAEDEALIVKVARDAVRQSDRIDIVRGEEIIRDLFIGGLRGENLEALGPALAQQESTAALLGGSPAAIKAQTMLTNKVLNLANATEDQIRSLEIMAGVQAGAIVVGESFNASTQLAALRTAGFANTISGEGLIGFALATDSLGQRAGSSLLRLSKELNTPLSQAGEGAGVSKGAVEGVIDSGIRGKQGLTDDQAERFLADPIKFIQTDLKAALEAKGVDTTDRVEVKQALAKFGFADTSQRLIMESLASIAETEKGRDLAANIADPTAVTAAAADDLGAALQNLTASFRSFTSEVLDPAFAALAPMVNSLAGFMEELALDDSATGQIKRLGVVAGVAASALAGLGLVKFSTGKLLGLLGMASAGPALTAAAGELTVAALALQRSAGVQAVGGGAAPAAAGGAAAFMRGLAQKAGVLFAGYLGAEAVVEGNRKASQLTPEEIDKLDADLKDVLFRWTGGMLGTSSTAALPAPSRDGLSLEDRDAKAASDMASTAGQLLSWVQRLESDTMAAPAMVPGNLSVQAEIASLQAIDAQRADDFSAGAFTFGDTFQTAAVAMMQTFMTGATELQTVGPTIDQAASAFGPAASEGLLAAAPAIGAAMAAAFGATVGPLSLDAPAAAREAPRLDTGASVPF